MFRDALPLLSAALAELGPGQLVKVADVALVQLLSAIEIMDHRTDAYVAHTLASSSAATDPLPKFDPTLELPPDELVWILDELLRLEVRPPRRRAHRRGIAETSFSLLGHAPRWPPPRIDSLHVPLHPPPRPRRALRTHARVKPNPGPEPPVGLQKHRPPRHAAWHPQVRRDGLG